MAGSRQRVPKATSVRDECIDATCWYQVDDNHDFQVEGIWAACRMQTLKCHHGRYLLVAVQDCEDVGSPLVTRAEDYAVDAVRRLGLVSSPVPPPMVVYIHHDAGRPFKMLTTFTLEGGRVVADFGSTHQWTAVLAAHASFGRGEERVARPAPRDPYVKVWVWWPLDDIPAADPFRAACMKQSRRSSGEDCCCYHRPSWSAAIAGLERSTSAVEPTAADTRAQVRAQLKADAGVSDQDRAAAESLLADPIDLDVHVGIINGQHRVQAMRDQGLGCRHVLVTTMLHEDKVSSFFAKRSGWVEPDAAW
jgi:hypothetical protein